MPDQLDAQTRTAIAEFLPIAMKAALRSYERFLHGPCDIEESKSFSEYHKACKLAINHVEILLTIAENLSLAMPEHNTATDDIKAQNLYNRAVKDTTINERALDDIINGQIVAKPDTKHIK